MPSSLIFLPCRERGIDIGRLYSEGSTTSTTSAPDRREAQVGRSTLHTKLDGRWCSPDPDMKSASVGARPSRPFGGIAPRRAAARQERTQRGLLRGARTFAHKKRRIINAILPMRVPTRCVPRASDIVDDAHGILSAYQHHVFLANCAVRVMRVTVWCSRPWPCGYSREFGRRTLVLGYCRETVRLWLAQ